MHKFPIPQSSLELARTPNPSLRIFLAAVYVFELQPKPKQSLCGSAHNPQLPPLPPHDTSVAGPARSAHPSSGTVLSTVLFIFQGLDRRCAVLLSNVSVVVRHSLSTNLHPPERLMDPFNASRQMKSRRWERGKSSIHRVKVFARGEMSASHLPGICWSPQP